MENNIRNVNFIEKLFSSLIIGKEFLIEEIIELKLKKFKTSYLFINTEKENIDDYLIKLISDFYLKLETEERLFLYHYFLISNVGTDFEIIKFNSKDSKIPIFLKVFMMYNIRIIFEKYLTNLTEEIEISQLIKIIKICKKEFLKPINLDEIYLAQLEEFYEEINEFKT